MMVHKLIDRVMFVGACAALCVILGSAAMSAVPSWGAMFSQQQAQYSNTPNATGGYALYVVFKNGTDTTYISDTTGIVSMVGIASATISYRFHPFGSITMNDPGDGNDLANYDDSVDAKVLFQWSNDKTNWFTYDSTARIRDTLHYAQPITNRYMNFMRGIVRPTRSNDMAPDSAGQGYPTTAYAYGLFFRIQPQYYRER